MGNRSSEDFKNIKELLASACVKRKNKIAISEKINNEIVSYTVERLQRDVNALGTKLIDMGLKDKHIAIIGENSYRWAVSYLAVINGVGVAVPLDKELPKNSLVKLLSAGDVNVLIFSKMFSSMIKDIKSGYSGLETFICMDDNTDGYVTLNELIEAGEMLLTDGNEEYINSRIDENALSVIVFTSGTTGPNKGVMLSHHNLMTVVKMATEYFKEYKYTISVLPLHHIYENVCQLLSPINVGAIIFFNDSLKYLPNNLKIFKPEMTVMVPLFLETMYKQMIKEINKRGFMGVFNRAVKISNWLLKFKIDLRRCMFRHILGFFGGRLRTIVCGGAYLRPELVKNYREIGINVINGYGITECSPLISVNIGENLKDDSVGKIVQYNKVKINNPDKNGIGEILVKGDNVMLGYYKDNESTKNSLKDGWFNTGDLGYVDEYNNLFITGRKKNLIVLSNGKNVHPEELESYVIEVMKYVKEVVVYTSKNVGGGDMIEASIFLDNEFLQQYNDEEIRKIVDRHLAVVNSNLPGFKNIHHMFIRENEFEKTTSQKIIRDVFLKEVVKNGEKS